MKDLDAQQTMLPSERLHDLTNFCQDLIDRRLTDSLAYKIYRHDKLISEGRFGYMSYERKKKIINSPLWTMGSCSKPLTAALAFTLVDKGLLSLTRPLGHYLPEIVSSVRECATVGDLLAHTSGIVSSDWWQRCRDIPFDIVVETDSTQNSYIQEMLRRCWDIPARHKPKTTMSYCGLNYVFVAYSSH